MPFIVLVTKLVFHFNKIKKNEAKIGKKQINS